MSLTWYGSAIAHSRRDASRQNALARSQQLLPLVKMVDGPPVYLARKLEATGVSGHAKGIQQSLSVQHDVEDTIQVLDRGTTWPLLLSLLVVSPSDRKPVCPQQPVRD